MAEGHEFPRVIRGHLPPGNFSKGICAEPEMSYNFEKCYDVHWPSRVWIFSRYSYL